jgi:hypothetical protein
MTMLETLNSTLDSDTESGSTPMTPTRQILTSPLEQTLDIEDTNSIEETNLDLENIVVEHKTNEDSTPTIITEKTLTNEDAALTNTDEKDLTNKDSILTAIDEKTFLNEDSTHTNTDENDLTNVDSSLTTIDENTITINTRLTDNQTSSEEILTSNPPLYDDIYVPKNSKIIKLVGEWKFCYSEMFEEFMM